MSTDYTLPPVPAGLSVPVGCEQIARDYGHACAEAAREPLLARLRSVCQTLVDAVGADGPCDAEDAAARAVARIAELEAALVLPSSPWVQQWHGSGPERGDHIMSHAGRVAYLPAPDGTQGLHDQAGAIVYAHNVALSESLAEIDRLRAEVEAKDARIAQIQDRTRAQSTALRAAESRIACLRAEVEALRAENDRNRRLLYGFMLDCNAIGSSGAGENLARGIKGSISAKRRDCLGDDFNAPLWPGTHRQRSEEK